MHATQQGVAAVVLRRNVLRECRERISPHIGHLGPVLRRAERVGKRVTQEEVAEAADVSREWYARLEAGRTARSSPILLQRLADTLMMNDDERRAVFLCAIPELRKAAPDGACAIAEQVASLRAVLRRLWAATSPDEVIQEVLEDFLGRFPRLDLAMASRRDAIGMWGKIVAPTSERVVSAIDDIHRAIRTEYSRLEEEEWNLCGALTQPGDVGFVAELLARSPLAPRVATTIARVGLGEFSIVAAHLRATDGFEANFALGYAGGRGTFSEADLAVVGAVAEFASYALER